MQEAMEALKPFSSTVPRGALEWVKTHWDAAEPLLLAELDARLAAPMGGEEDARFSYALYLCADRRCPEAFPRYLALSRLPNVILDRVLGDILTEWLPHMLARTCAGRIGELRALVEDTCVNPYARGSAMEALWILALDGTLAREELAEYSVQLLQFRLERRRSHVWNVVAGVAADIQADGAMPLIEKAYERELADPMFCDLESIREQYARTAGDSPEPAFRHGGEWRGVEEGMSFFVGDWEEDSPPEDPIRWLKVLEKRQRERAIVPVPSVGRNEPCPCGSGLKFKKCCLAKVVEQVAAPQSCRGRVISEEHRVASDWMEAGYLCRDQSKSRGAFACWRECWKELRFRLPSSLKDPADAEESGAFEGSGLLVEWLEDFRILLSDHMNQSADMATQAMEFSREVLARFPDMDEDMRVDFRVDLARAQGYLGFREEALAEVEALIAEAPDKAGGYVLLAEMRGEEAMEFNMPLDVPGAIACLETARRRAGDAEDYAVKERLRDLKEWHRSMQEPM